MNIRIENSKDYKTVENVIEESFKNAEHTDHQEQFLVNRLRKRNAFIPELSLVCEIDDNIVGHILLTKINIVNGDKKVPSLALAPVSVLPAYQNKGIGSKLINEVLTKAHELGYESVVVLGHANYYPRFGFVLASTFNIKAPFDVPNEFFMVKELKKDALKYVEGIVLYDNAFLE